MADTFARSMDHWSEDKRAGMDAFYALATVDYRHLAQAHDWRGFLEREEARVGRPLRLIDVACGSGKFPTALVDHAGVGEAAVAPIAYELLDPSAFSLAEARAVLRPPLAPAGSHETTLQGLQCERGAYDIAWATHALYAVPAAEREAAMARFLHAIGDEGVGVLAHAMGDAHYLAFYRHFLADFRGGEGEPYTGGDDLAEALRTLGAKVEVREITYENTAPESASAGVEGFLQRCAFDDTVTLAEMRAAPTLGPYLDACLVGGEWRFSQRVALTFVGR